MVVESTLNPPTYHERDDAYWSALFQEEATIEAISDETKSKVEDSFPVEPSPEESAVAWAEATAVMEQDKCVQLTISGYNKGGLLVYWQNLQGFVPASQLIDFPQFHMEAARLQALKERLHQTLTLKFVAIDRQQNRLILSERATLVKAVEKENLLHTVKIGTILTGAVTNLTNFGAFVDLGGIEGLIHVSELSWSRVSHPSQIVTPGQDVRVYVIKVDVVNERIALSLKRLKPDPWQSVESNYQPGQIVRGIVSNVVNYGAFILLEDELEGLVHISELAEGSFLHPHNVVCQGDKVAARVLTVDGPGKRLALSLRHVNQDTDKD